MTKVAVYSISFILIVFILTIFIKKDIETVYDKHLLHGEKICLMKNNNRIAVTNEDIDRIKSILNNKNNRWSISFATYAVSNYFSSSSKKLTFGFLDGHIIINYNHTFFGWVQLVSRKKYLEVEKYFFDKYIMPLETNTIPHKTK